MSEVSICAKSLAAALRVVSPSVANAKTRRLKPALGCVRLAGCGHGLLAVIADNLDTRTAARVEHPGGPSVTLGDCAVDYARLRDALKGVSGMVGLTARDDGAGVVLQTVTATVELPGAPVAEFPADRMPAASSPSVTIPAAEWRA